MLRRSSERVSCHLALSWSQDLVSPRGYICFVVVTVMYILFHLEILNNSNHIAAFDCPFQLGCCSRFVIVRSEFYNVLCFALVFCTGFKRVLKGRIL